MEIGDFKIDNRNFQKFRGAHFDNRFPFQYFKHGLTYWYSRFKEYFNYPLILRFSKFIEKLMRSC